MDKDATSQKSLWKEESHWIPANEVLGFEKSTKTFSQKHHLLHAVAKLMFEETIANSLEAKKSFVDFALKKEDAEHADLDTLEYLPMDSPFSKKEEGVVTFCVDVDSPQEGRCKKFFAFRC